MKKPWCPKTAEKALIDTVKLCGPEAESNAAEMISALAGGWKSKLIVEAWSNGCDIATSIGLAVAASHTGGLHVCIVNDEISRLEYTDSMENQDVPMPEVVVIGTCREFLERLDSIDFLVIQGEQDDFMKLFGRLKLCHLGAVVAWTNIKFCGFRWQRILEGGFYMVRSFVLPNGLDIAYVDAAASGSSRHGQVRWVRHVDHETGEEHILRR